MSYVLKPEEVNSPETLARFCQEQTGIPYPSKGQIAVLRKAVKEFFEKYPTATYTSLTNLVKWSKDNHRRYAQTANLISGGTRYAFAAGYLPELDPKYSEKSVGDLINEALAVETDPIKRDVLITNWNKAAYDQWLHERNSNEAK
jgi:hypothetical protein